MNVVLKRTKESVLVYLDGELATEFKNQSVEKVKSWIQKNLLQTKIATLFFISNNICFINLFLLHNKCVFKRNGQVLL